MYGETGLGKTHLSLAIANEVIKKGFSVVYDSAQNLFTRLEKERFGREGGNTEDTVLYCDLLIWMISAQSLTQNMSSPRYTI